MSLLGNVGSLYMLILIVILIISFGLIALKVIKFILSIDMQRNNFKIKATDNKWVLMVMISFAGIIVSTLVLIIIMTPFKI